MNAKKIMVLLLSTFLVVGSFAGCKKTDTANTDKTSTDVTFPLKTKIVLKDWIRFSSTLIKTLDENKVYQELEKKTNIHIEFIHPAAGQEIEQFNVMLASNAMPDLISAAPVLYPGGFDKAIADKVYVKLNDYIDKYAPNYKKLRASNPEIAKQTMTDAGNIFGFACVQLGLEPAWDGMIARQDWLDELGLKVPTTIDEWHNVLVQFKKKSGVTPLLFNAMDKQFNQLRFSGALVSAYNTTNDFFNENGTVKYGVIQPGYKSFLTTMSQWYKEGLIDKDFPTRDDKGATALFTSGKAGAMYNTYGSFGGFDIAGTKIDPKFQIVGVGNVPAVAGEAVHFRQTNGYNKNGSEALITTANKHIPETVKWLDYGYSDEGFLLCNYGVEKTSWDWKTGPVADIDKPFFPAGLRDQDKHPVFNDFMLKNPSGAAFYDLSLQYKLPEQAYLRDPMAGGEMAADVKIAMNAWSKPGNDWMMPAISSTDTESKEMSPIMTDVNTYVDEMNLKFIMGIEPLSKFDDFVAKIKAMGIDTVTKDQQAGLDRYKTRK